MIVFAAAQEPIFAFASVAVQPGDHVIAVVPTYQSLYEVARSRGADVSRVPLRPDWTLDVEAIRRELRPNTSLIVLNAPNQPTGSIPSEAELRELSRSARACSWTRSTASSSTIRATGFPPAPTSAARASA